MVVSGVVLRAKLLLFFGLYSKSHEVMHVPPPTRTPTEAAVVESSSAMSLLEGEVEGVLVVAVADDEDEDDVKSFFK